MNKLLLCIAFTFFGCLNLYAQKIYNFKLDSTQTKIANSLYNSLSVLDYRGDTTSIGFIFEGMMERYAKVKPATPISVQFKTLFNSVIDGTATNGKLLLQITRLIFAERENELNYDAYFNLRANLYSKIGENYQLVSTIDTLVDKRSFIPAKELLKSANEVMSDFIIKNLLVKPSGQMLTYYDVLHINNIEKDKIALYKTAVYTDGLYLTYKSFRNQMPDRQIIVDSAELNSGDIRTIEGGGVTKKVNANDIYAIVYHGRPYIASEGHYYPLNKINNDFFFVGKATTSTITPGHDLVSAIAGEKTKSLGINLPTAMFEIEIDYKNGLFIRLKKIPDFKPAATAQSSNN